MLIHLGALQRLNELGFLRSLRIVAGENTGFPMEERRIGAHWNRFAKGEITGNIIEIFAPAVRALRAKENWILEPWRWDEQFPSG
jgi:hypothetical protein